MLTKNISGRSFIAIMLVVSVLALLLRVAIGQINKISIIQNESTAAATLRLISAALENYAKDKGGQYPADFSLLMNTTPPYVEKNYLSGAAIKGYYYGCSRLEPSGYSCYANPVKCQVTGSTSYSVGTGGLFISENCKTKE